MATEKNEFSTFEHIVDYFRIDKSGLVLFFILRQSKKNVELAGGAGAGGGGACAYSGT